MTFSDSLVHFLELNEQKHLNLLLITYSIITGKSTITKLKINYHYFCTSRSFLFVSVTEIGEPKNKLRVEFLPESLTVISALLQVSLRQSLYQQYLHI